LIIGEREVGESKLATEAVAGFVMQDGNPGISECLEIAKE